jgi:hypothetical protein
MLRLAPQAKEFVLTHLIPTLPKRFEEERRNGRRIFFALGRRKAAMRAIQIKAFSNPRGERISFRVSHHGTRVRGINRLRSPTGLWHPGVAA